MTQSPLDEGAYKKGYKKKDPDLLPDDPRPEWEEENRIIEDRKPDLSEIEEDSSNE